MDLCAALKNNVAAKSGYVPADLPADVNRATKASHVVRVIVSLDMDVAIRLEAV